MGICGNERFQSVQLEDEWQHSIPGLKITTRVLFLAGECCSHLTQRLDVCAAQLFLSIVFALLRDSGCADLSCSLTDLNRWCASSLLSYSIHSILQWRIHYGVTDVSASSKITGSQGSKFCSSVLCRQGCEVCGMCWNRTVQTDMGQFLAIFVSIFSDMFQTFFGYVHSLWLPCESVI